MLVSKSNFMTVKVHPQVVIPSASCYFTSKQETYTIWMKSLVLGCKGCTVFDAKGQLVYRVDNYNCNFRDEVNLMDSKGKVLFTVPRKRFKLFRFWEGYRSTDKEIEMKRPGFQVRKTLRIPRGDSPCEVIVGLDENQPRHYKIHSWSSCKSACKLVDQFGGLVAEVNLFYNFSHSFILVELRAHCSGDRTNISCFHGQLKRKKSAGGVDLGNDVLTLVVEPYFDHSLIMGVFVVYCLINCKM
ncbi:hypothetical protein F2P56_003693 [Juglans regia]|uniref:Protein LURP-one-related 11-like n=2 Tax=Juglans regia TaxID=51240 RepID=A0A833Y451_JUGRE|nr:protein LURP-one-related 3-like isoform X1 [Juglans regia]KAF5477013.1 hypothetical protein F2P56_003693 [Juglans regia]